MRNPENIRVAIREINPKPIGIEGISALGFLDPRAYVQINPNLRDVLDDLDPVATIQSRIIYKEEPDPVEEIQIKRRTVLNGTVADRIVQRAISRKLTVLLDSFFCDNSYGFRPGRSPELAIQRVRAAVRHGAHWAFKTDIEKFFPNVQRRILTSALKDCIEDQELRDYLMIAISPYVRTTGKCFVNGLPQGNGLSPLLSNIYLHALDHACSRLSYFRYADDILVLAPTCSAAFNAALQILHLLTLLGLPLSVRKSTICDVYEEPIMFLGYELRGGNVYPPQAAIHCLGGKLRVRGQRDRVMLLKDFARRYSVGPVRKLFRRLDRDLDKWYPQGISLTSLLDHHRAEGNTQSSRAHWRPRG